VEPLCASLIVDTVLSEHQGRRASRLLGMTFARVPCMLWITGEA
jgi:hypothetical protein